MPTYTIFAGVNGAAKPQYIELYTTKKISWKKELILMRWWRE